jgi:glycosyltransferase involved in cell wall biosynthesis
MPVRAPVADDPLVSVLMPTRNRAALIAESVRSVLEQNFESHELIVIDDHSDDSTLAVLAEFDDPRLRVVSAESRGIGGALNAGSKVARGRFIARNDSDDVWSRDLLSTLVPALQQSESLGFVYAPARVCDAALSPTGEWRGRRLPDPDDPLRCLVWTDYTCSITTLYRAELVREVGGWDATLGTSEDWDLALRVAREHDVGFVEQPLAQVRVHAGNSTHRDRADLERRLLLRVRVLDKLFATSLPPHVAALKEAAYRNVFVGAGIQLWRGGRRRSAWRAFSMAVKSGNRIAGCVRIVGVAMSWRSARFGRVAARVEPLLRAWQRNRLDRLARRVGTA